jgi:membrane protein YdbS with pleckstrin-like domain
MRCAQCGAEMAQGAAFCSRCGARLFAPRPAAQREFALLRVWPSWWEFAQPILVAILIIGAGVYLLFTHRQDWGFVPILWMLGFAILVATAISRRRISWSLTSERLIERSGMIASRERHLELADIRSVEIDQKAWQKLLGLGDVIVASAASAEFSIRLKSVADPRAIAEKIRQARLKRLG